MMSQDAIDLQQIPGDLPTIGMSLMSLIHSIVPGELPEFETSSMGFGVRKSDQGPFVLVYQIKDGDLQHGNSTDWLFIWRKMSMIVETLSILTFSNSWIDDKIWSDGKVVWTRPLGVQLVPDKEGHPNTPLPTFPGPELNVMTINVMHHIATTYPRVWAYHRVGCYLLRTSFPGEEFNADILLNFFKIGELVTTAMYKRNPRLSDIQRASAELGLRNSFPDDAIRDFYKVRSRDAAHDWLNARPVDRSTALDCKNWSEAMLGLHWWRKGQKVVRLGRREADGRTSIWPELTDGDSPEDWQIPH